VPAKDQGQVFARHAMAWASVWSKSCQDCPGAGRSCQGEKWGWVNAIADSGDNGNSEYGCSLASATALKCKPRSQL